MERMALTGAITDSGEAAPARPHASATGYLPEIDAYRCFAMSIVVLMHCGLLPFGWTGVWLFYVISGFAITTSLLNSDEPHPSKGVMIRNFVLRRAIRIWPAYVFYVLLNLVVAAFVHRLDIVQQIPYLFTFVYNYRLLVEGGNWAPYGHLWTISVEEQFYLVFPILFAFLSRKNLERALWALVIGAPIARLLAGLYIATTHTDIGWRSFAIYANGPLQFDILSMGALLALNRARIAANPRIARFLAIAAAIAGALYFATYAFINIADGAHGVNIMRNVISGWLWGQGRHIFVYSAVGLTAAAIIANVITGARWALALGRLPFAQWIGRISYGAYLYHLLILWSVTQILPPLHPWSFVRQATIFALVYPATLLASHLSYRFIERPVLQLRKRFP